MKSQKIADSIAALMKTLQAEADQTRFLQIRATERVRLGQAVTPLDLAAPAILEEQHFAQEALIDRCFDAYVQVRP